MKINLVQRCPRRLKRCRGKYKENKKNILGEEIMWTKIQTSQEIQYAIAMERPRWLKCSFPEVVGKWVKWVENLGPINGKLWGNCSSQIKHWRQPKDLSGSSIQHRLKGNIQIKAEHQSTQSKYSKKLNLNLSFPQNGEESQEEATQSADPQDIQDKGA